MTAPIYATDGISVTYYDSSQSIIWVQVKRAWTSDDMLHGFEAINRVHAASAVPTYTIIELLGDASLLPAGIRVSTVKYLFEMDFPAEQLCIFVNHRLMIRTMLDTVSHLYGLHQIFAKYRFVETLGDGLELIAAHRALQGITAGV
jgi:uncharacterized membrane protein